MRAIANMKKGIMRVSDSKDLIKYPDLLYKYIKDHDEEVKYRYDKYWEAYTCEPEIFDHDIIPDKSHGKPDHRISANIVRLLVDIYTGFARGIPVKTLSEDPATAEYIKHFRDYNDMDDVEADLHRNKVIFGESYQMGFIDESKEGSAVCLTPREAFPIYRNSIRLKIRYFLHTYCDEDDNRHGTISDDKYVYYFDIDPEGSDEHIVFTAKRPHGFNTVPVSVYKMGPDSVGIPERIMSMADEINNILSSKSNDVDSFSDTILKVFGILLEEKDLNDLKDKRILNLEGEEAKDVIAEYIEKPSGDVTQEHLYDRLEKAIYRVACVCDVSDDNFVATSGIALRLKMTPMSNAAIAEWRNDRASMKRFWRMMFENKSNRSYNYDWETLEFVNTLNYPDDVENTVDMVVKLKGIVSNRTLLTMLPDSIVPDVDAELEQIKAEQSEDEEETEEETEEQIEAVDGAENVTEEIVIGESEDN